MRDPIARALAWALVLLPPRGRRTRRAHQAKAGRHSAAYLAHLAGQPQIPPGTATATSAPADPWRAPWRAPWRGPSAREARAIFKAREAAALDPVRRERFFATAWAERGYDYPYVAPDVHQVHTGSAA